LVLRKSQMVLYTGTRSNDSSEIVMYSLRDGRRSRLPIKGAPLSVVDDVLVFANVGVLHAARIDVSGMALIGEPVQLSKRAGHHTTGTAAAVSEGGTLVYEGDPPSSLSRLELVTLAGSRTALRGNDQYGAARFSPDGRRIAVAIKAVGASQSIAAASDIWVIDIATREAVRVTNSGDAETPEWSADGTRMMYVTTGSRRREVWSVALDGSIAASRLVEDDGDVQSAVATPDGQSLIMSRWGNGDARLELIRVALSGPRRIDTLVSPRQPNDVRPVSARVSPDGRFVAFADRSLRTVHVRALEGTGEVQISTNGGCCPLWAPDSRRVYFRDRDKLVAVDLDMTRGPSVAKRAISQGFWTAGASLQNPDDLPYDLASDGRTFVVATPASDVAHSAKVFVVYNWVDELRRELAAAQRR
jgi:Tol biopolymer transport system component